MINADCYSKNFDNGSGSNYQDWVDQACRVVQQQTILRPKVAFVLGSGLGPLAEHVQHAVRLNYSDLPGFPLPGAAGHNGRLILGYLGGLPVVLLQGRCHRYEGRNQREIQFPIHVVHGLGAELLITTNAAGGLNSRFCVGDLMAIDSHINFFWSRTGFPPSRDAFGRSAGNPYTGWLIRRVHEIARRKLVVMHRGCYLGTLGPTYETRSEYRFFRWTGADAVGMSTIDEVLAAQKLKMEVLGISVITNVACPDVATSTTHEEVIQAGDHAGPRLLSVLVDLLEELSGQPD